MLGHKLYQRYRDRYDIWATFRRSFVSYAHYNLFDSNRIITGVDAFNIDTVTHTIAQVQPDVVINCIGIIKQLNEAKNPIISIMINSLLPHRVATLCRAAGARFFHISTDCVFNGHDGNYTEESPSNAEDLYGRSKFLGEVTYPGCLTLRTSIIGRQLRTTSGLIEWFLSHRAATGGQVRGFTKAIYTGFTTQVMADIIADLIDNHGNLSGMYQVSSDKINKYDLLMLAKQGYNMDINIEPDDQVRVDRSLDSTRFRAETGFRPPTWAQMIQEMAADPTPYDEWR